MDREGAAATASYYRYVIISNKHILFDVKLKVIAQCCDPHLIDCLW